MTDQLDATAQRLAERGRDALIARLREAYAQAARTHSDILSIDGARLEELVQRSADRADGLQWRRALADVACDELGVGLVEALHHPAVARAQELVGAPSYEDSLNELTERTDGAAEPVSERASAGVSEGASAGVSEDVPQSSRRGVRQEPATDQAPEEGPDGALRVAAVHLGGVASLDPDESGIHVRLSPAGLDIIRHETEVVGRLHWSDIDNLEVAERRGVRRRRGDRARLIVRTPGGDASFEVAALTPGELRSRLAPLVARYGRD